MERLNLTNIARATAPRFVCGVSLPRLALLTLILVLVLASLAAAQDRQRGGSRQRRSDRQGNNRNAQRDFQQESAAKPAVAAEKAPDQKADAQSGRAAPNPQQNASPQPAPSASSVSLPDLYKVVLDRNMFSRYRMEKKASDSVAKEVVQLPAQEYIDLVGALLVDDFTMIFFESSDSRFSGAFLSGDTVGDWVIDEVATEGVVLKAKDNTTIDLPVGLSLCRTGDAPWKVEYRQRSYLTSADRGSRRSGSDNRDGGSRNGNWGDNQGSGGGFDNHDDDNNDNDENDRGDRGERRGGRENRDEGQENQGGGGNNNGVNAAPGGDMGPGGMMIGPGGMMGGPGGMPGAMPGGMPGGMPGAMPGGMGGPGGAVGGPGGMGGGPGGPVGG